MKNAIVTGASGFVGRWLIQELLGQGIGVQALVRPGSKTIKYLQPQPGLEIVACEAGSYADLPTLLDPREDCVFYHLAWGGVSGPERNSLELQQANVQCAVEAVRAAKALGCVSFVGLGSIMELETHQAAMQEGVRPNSNYIYGEAKHFAHLATKAEAARLGLDYFWPMLTNAYGEYEYSARFINTTLRKILQGEPLEFTAGTQLYDFIYIEDAVKALRLIAQKGKSFSSYLVGSGQVQPLRSWLECLGSTLAPELPLLFGNIPYSGVRLESAAFSSAALKQDTGFEPQVAFEEGLQRTMSWLQREMKK